MKRSSYYFDKVEQCRRLAATLTARDDPAIGTLLALAAEFEAKAIEGAIRENAAMVMRNRALGLIPRPA